MGQEYFSTEILDIFWLKYAGVIPAHPLTLDPVIDEIIIGHRQFFTIGPPYLLALSTALPSPPFSGDEFDFGFFEGRAQRNSVSERS